MTIMYLFRSIYSAHKNPVGIHLLELVQGLYLTSMVISDSRIKHHWLSLIESRGTFSRCSLNRYFYECLLYKSQLFESRSPFLSRHAICQSTNTNRTQSFHIGTLNRIALGSSMMNTRAY